MPTLAKHIPVGVKDAVVIREMCVKQVEQRNESNAGEEHRPEDTPGY
jgi:hypothetical protein